MSEVFDVIGKIGRRKKGDYLENKKEPVVVKDCPYCHEDHTHYHGIRALDNGIMERGALCNGGDYRIHVKITEKNRHTNFSNAQVDIMAKVMYMKVKAAGKACEYCDPDLNDASFLCRNSKKSCHTIGDKKEECGHYNGHNERLEELKKRGIL